MVKAFPSIERQMGSRGDEDYNPSIRLFGRRFFADQTVPELLLEMLLVAISPKRIDKTALDTKDVFPDVAILRSWPNRVPLEYAPKARLNLKLFAFLKASKLETRHESHRQHYRDLFERMRRPDKLSISASVDAGEVLGTLENLFLGFQSVGGQRTWCAQAFLPISREVIGAETLWNETDARRDNVRDWDSVVDRFLHFFSLGRHRFLARGGELLYLQVCNALRQDPGIIQRWAAESGLSLSPREKDPEKLHTALTQGLSRVLDACPEAVGRLAAFIDTGVDAETSPHTDYDSCREPRFASCGWCPSESWPEGLLFAVELLRLCEVVVDPIERLELLEIACAMQVLRSLCAQSARYVDWLQGRDNAAGPLRYVWAISDPGGRHGVIKQISRRNVNTLQRMMHDAVRHPSILQGLADRGEEELGKVYKEADGRYGHKLFLTLAKRIGLIVPKRGVGARFVLSDRLLRFLVMSTIRPGERVTYDSFKKLIFAHHGIAVDDEMVGRSCEWCGTGRLTTLGGAADAWLTDMLEASGVLVRLSDSCSLVTNPFDGGEKAA